MVEPQLDDVNPRPLDIQRLARLAARAEEASRSPSPLSDQLPLISNGTSRSAGASGNGVAVHGHGRDVAIEQVGGGVSGTRGPRLLRRLSVLDVVPFVLETMCPSKPHKPSITAFYFMASITLNRRAPITLLRAVLRAAILFFEMRFGQDMRSIHEGFARWWAHQLLLEQTESRKLQDKTAWSAGVAMSVEL
eukprot:TRINITY_DN5214_c0_g1_i1.p1 TRINITY_DN5214_c0_g1~~TRINITY_DN5214_c0_g1_i1.p1  ORF type:complete len:192 (+),score=34.60 TRINITY_DN5214_c0_g1_i1:365-940(+)